MLFFNVLNSFKFIARQNLTLSNHFLNYSTRKVGVIGVPFSKGQKQKGTEIAPKFLRDCGLIDELKKIENLIVNDFGDITYRNEKLVPLRNALNFDDFYSVNKVLSTKIPEILSKNDQFVVLGGDHSIGFGSLAGHLSYEPNTSVIWIDAHADINTNLSSTSGSIHGMPLSMVIEELKHVYAKTTLNNIVKNYLRAKNLYYIGLRDVDPFEKNFIKEHSVTAFGIKDIEKLGMPKICEIVLDSIGAKRKIHISFDIDSLDPIIAPSTGTSVLGGITLRELFYVLEELNQTGNVQGFDITEINPLLGNKRDVELTTKAGIEAVKIIMGHKRFF